MAAKLSRILISINNGLKKTGDIQQLKAELNSPSLKSGQLRSSLDAAEGREHKADVEELRSNLMDKKEGLGMMIENKQHDNRESELQGVEKLEADLTELKANLTAKETELNIEEADKSNRRAAWVSEELDSAQAANTEMEAELRRIKVQADQWRKAAEAAAAMLTNNGKHSEKSMSFDINYKTTIGWEDMEEEEDDSSKKKNGNMLKKIGVLWKKGQK
ncbi:hypothetical protein V6N13_141701 [Hibiscus sabdariffa]|uniref:Uncharacterized protein n=1 Tax=Hibiscus sabdariffa TaxID=183260 RepID=A0ABR2BCE0_9ROSI